jgi:hypothetical protein
LIIIYKSNKDNKYYETITYFNVSQNIYELIAIGLFGTNIFDGNSYKYPVSGPLKLALPVNIIQNSSISVNVSTLPVYPIISPVTPIIKITTPSSNSSNSSAIVYQNAYLP